ncbi:MAG: glucose-1-phosphate adenylyltransferase, partial [Oscillospiraceae bacterium]|nr:glucose-1-phosphate adenylyltransferase [Oscillospiraceae bacterium]
IVAEDAVVGAGAVVGERPEAVDDIGRWGVAVLGSGVHIGAGATVRAKAMLYSDVEQGATV